MFGNYISQCNIITTIFPASYTMKTKSHYAILSGACASAGSLFGKLAGLPTFEGFFEVRIIFIILMIVCNAGVWTLFVKALQATESSLSATITSTASNYLISALTGFFIFGEVTSLLWWFGTTLVLFGLILIIKDENSHGDKLLTEINKTQ